MNDCGCLEYNRLSRRHFLGVGAASMLGLLHPELLYGAVGPRATTKSVILLWMNGGQSHIDTWDPKPGRPTGGPIAAIETAVKGIQISEHMPRLATQFKDISLIRSLTSQEGSHERAQYLMHTGYMPLGSFQHSALGSTVWKMKGRGNPDLPAYVHVGSGVLPAGHLGSEYAPFQVGSPEGATDNIEHHRSVNAQRFERRLDLLRRLDNPFARRYGKAEVVKAYGDYYNAAHRMMKSDSAAAFDLEREQGDIRTTYGETFFGQGCLLARRLVQAGVRFVEVTLGGWDTHQDNFARVAELSGQVDRAVAALLDDLRRLKLLDHTLVVLCSEFGRTPEINPNSGRDHWPRVWSAMLAGGGIAGGRVIGESTPDGHEVARDPVQVGELHATVCKCMDIDPTVTNYAADGRPIRIVENLKHKAVAGLF